MPTAHKISSKWQPLSEVIKSIPRHEVHIIPKPISTPTPGQSEDAFRLPEEIIPKEVASEKKIVQEAVKKLFDHIELRPAKGIEPLLADIKIEDPKVKAFIESQLTYSFARSLRKLWRSLFHESFKYYLIYDNQYDKEGFIRQEGVGLVLLYAKGDRTFVVPYDLTPTKATKIHLESIFRKDFPREIITWPSEVSLDNKVWGAIYEKVTEKGEKIAGKEVTIPKQLSKVWPFPFPKGEPIRRATPRKPSKEKLKIYLNACRRETIIRLEALGNFLLMMGHGLLQGVILYPILDLAQNLKLYALIGLLLEFAPYLHAKINNQTAEEVDHLEAHEAFIESQNKKIPLWDLGAKYQTMRALIKRQWLITLTYITSSFLNFLIFPDIFEKLWGVAASLFSSAYFVFAFLLNETLFTGASIVEDPNTFKILKHFKKNQELKKDFWTVRATHENIELLTRQISFGAGFGIYYLSGFDSTVGIGLAGAGLALSTFKFLLPAFGREENSLLTIDGPFTRYGQYLKFSPKVRLWIKPGSKINVIGDGKVIIPDPNSEVSGLILADLNLYQICHERLRLPFWSREKIVLKPNQGEGPRIALSKYGGHLTFEEFAKYLAQNDFAILAEGDKNVPPSSESPKS